MISTRKLLKKVSLLLIFFFFGNSCLFSQENQKYKLLKGEVISDSLNVLLLGLDTVLLFGLCLCKSNISL